MKTPKTKKTSTIRQRRRNAVLDVVARRFTGDPSQRFTGICTIFTNAILPKDITESDLDNISVSHKLDEILEVFSQNVKKYNKGKATDLIEVISTMPRQPTTRRTKTKK